MEKTHLISRKGKLRKAAEDETPRQLTRKTWPGGNQLERSRPSYLLGKGDAGQNPGGG